MPRLRATLRDDLLSLDQVPGHPLRGRLNLSRLPALCVADDLAERSALRPLLSRSLPLVHGFQLRCASKVLPTASLGFPACLCL
ncbi:hypothetical protein [Rhodococcus qingshengii]|uniref:hypothetical protein n=1 Tax=Rhodococcus qingshengii TaxID=334542 RepID=UPI00111C8B5F|nr:hypothetical protein [Rhodococcus qingshengii]